MILPSVGKFNWLFCFSSERPPVISLDYSYKVRAPVEVAFEQSMKPKNWAQHFSELDDLEIIKETDEEIIAQATYRLFLKSDTFEMHVNVVEPYEHIIVAFDSGLVSGEAHYYYEEIEEGTRITAEGTYSFGESRLVRILEPVLKAVTEWKGRRAAKKEEGYRKRRRILTFPGGRLCDGLKS